MFSYFNRHSTLSPLSLISPSLPLLGHLHRLSSFSRTIPLKSTQNNVSPPNSFQRHPLPLRALQRENPFIFDSRLSRNGSNVSRNHDKCNQAGFWWANGWTRTPLLCQEWYYIWQLCHIFLKSFSLISRQKALEIPLTFRSIFLCFHTFLSEKRKGLCLF